MGDEDIKPVILIEGHYNKSDVLLLKKNARRYHNIFESQSREMFEITHAQLAKQDTFEKEFQKEFQNITDQTISGNYIYFPSSGVLLHTLDEKSLRQLRLNRTQHLMTDDDLKKAAKFTAGIAGLSFGNGIALSLVYSGFSDTIKIADSDIFETTNLNRVRFGLQKVGMKKTKVTAEEIYDINPYANITTFDQGITDENIGTFIHGDRQLSILFDVVDDLSMKIKLRIAAKERGIPVVMLTSLEDSILVDIERYDIDKNTQIFHGALGDKLDDLLDPSINEKTKARYAMRIVEPQNISARNLRSLSEIGNTLVSRPHLYSTVSIVCGLASFIAKRIALDEDLPSMRRLVKFHEILGLEQSSHDTKPERDKILEILYTQ